MIPVHHLPENPGTSIGVEHIRKVKSEVQNEVHRHDFHELFFIKEGGGEHMIDLQHFKIQPPCLHIVAPGQVHQLSRSGNTSGPVVMFGPDVEFGIAHSAKKQLFRPGSASILKLKPAQLKSLLHLIQQLEGELQNTTQVIAAGFLGILLMKCADHVAASEEVKDPQQAPIDTVDRFRSLLEDRFQKDRKVSSYALALNITPGHLNELCKKRLGKSASGVILTRTLLEAKRLLLHSDASIKEVAYALNMQDPAYFTRMFKKGTGYTPQSFRESIREKYK